MVLDKYCHPDKTIAFSTPTANVVNAYITERPELSYLPPCAQTGVSYAVMGQVSLDAPVIPPVTAVLLKFSIDAIEMPQRCKLICAMCVQQRSSENRELDVEPDCAINLLQ